MIVLAAIGYAKPQDDFVQESWIGEPRKMPREIGAYAKHELISARLKGVAFQQRVVASAVGIGGGAVQRPWPGGDHAEPYVDASDRASTCCIKHMCRQFSRLDWLIHLATQHGPRCVVQQ